MIFYETKLSVHCDKIPLRVSIFKPILSWVPGELQGRGGWSLWWLRGGSAASQLHRRREVMRIALFLRWMTATQLRSCLRRWGGARQRFCRPLPGGGSGGTQTMTMLQLWCLSLPNWKNNKLLSRDVAVIAINGCGDDLKHAQNKESRNGAYENLIWIWKLYSGVWGFEQNYPSSDEEKAKLFSEKDWLISPT